MWERNQWRGKSCPSTWRHLSSGTRTFWSRDFVMLLPPFCFCGDFLGSEKVFQWSTNCRIYVSPSHGSLISTGRGHLQRERQPSGTCYQDIILAKSPNLGLAVASREPREGSPSTRTSVAGRKSTHLSPNLLRNRGDFRTFPPTHTF